MIKRLFVALSLVASLVSYAQEGSSSPYSFYGLGETRFKGTAENRSMGGISFFPDSIHMNLQNPAFYPGLKLTGLSLGASYNTTNLKTNADESKARRTTLDYLAVAIPMGKFGAGFGLMPYTSVGYKIQSINYDTSPAQLRKYQGSGGLNKAFLGAGYQITKKLSVGAEFGYYFGSIETSSIASIQDVQYGTRELDDSKANGPGLNLGLAYNSKVGKKLTFSAGLTYSPQTKLVFNNERKIATIQFLSTGTRVVEEENVDVANTSVKMPAKFTFGAGIGEMKKWMIGAGATFSQSADMGNRFADIEGAEFKNGMKVNVGGYYIPNYASFTDYWKRVTYRAGLIYEDTGLVLNDKNIKDAGMTLGLGLPLGGTFSNINFGFEYGKRGTRDAGLVEENYVNFTLGLSFNDRWFVRRKYD
ncbi:MAG: hypothetical protein EOO48_10715 [Flavobacterium sp.]|nr:MAG: hypothetical protein EOO48_10715 [Flavobacterium sp.]